MSVSEQLTEDLKTSMKAGDAKRTGVIRLLRGAMKNEEIKAGHALSDDEAMKVLVREAKQRRDSIDAYQNASRQDLVDVEAGELEIISGYLPQAMDEAELLRLIDGTIAELGITDVKAMGRVIGAVTGKVGARADGGTVARLVRARLSGGQA